MKQKLLYLFGLLFFTSLVSNAQTVSITANASSTQLNGLGHLQYHVSEYIYTEAEIGASNFTTAGTAINKINLNASVVGTPNFFNNVKIYLMNVPSTTTAFTAGTYSTAGYTEVFSGTFTAPAVGWVGVTLNTPFVRTAGTNLQMMIERTDNVDHSSAAALFTWITANGNNLSASAATSRRYNGAAALTGATQLATSAFRVATQFINAPANDLTVERIVTLGKINNSIALPHVIKATIKNLGTSSVAGGKTVVLNISGANTFSSSKTTSTLAPGASEEISFDPIASLPSAGLNSISVSVPTDDNNANNTANFGQTVVTNGGFSYADTSVRSSSVGFNAGSGLLVSRHTFSSSINISAVRALITTQSNTMYGVVCNSAGVIIGQSPNYVVQPSDSGTYVTFNFTNPVNIGPGPDSVFFIGIAQTVGAYGYFPLGTQTETPARPNTFASIPLAGGAPTYYTTLGRFMIEGIASATLPLNLSYFNGRLSNRNAELVWATLTESNTDKFEVERMSGASANWTKIATINASGNSTSFKTYSFSDKELTNGKHLYRLKMIDKDGKFTYSNVLTLEVSSKNLFVLNQNYPNPVKGLTQLSYQLNNEGKVVIELFTQDGRRVASLVNQQQAAGTYSFSVDIQKYGLATGNYNYRMIVVDKNNQELFRATKTMVVTQ